MMRRPAAGGHGRAGVGAGAHGGVKPTARTIPPTLLGRRGIFQGFWGYFLIEKRDGLHPKRGCGDVTPVTVKIFGCHTFLKRGA